MAVSSVAAFWATALLLIVVPGADWAFIIGAALRDRVVVPAVAGLVIGYAGVTAVVVAGVGALIARSPLLLTGLTLAGGLYLMWLGGTALARPATPPLHAAEPAGSGSGRSALGKGIGVSGLNPKGLLIFFALLPQFTDPDGSWPVAGQLAVLGVVFTVNCAVFYGALGTCARLALRTRPSTARVISRISGAAMILVGALLIIERLIG